jgi:hypothetical protein
MRVWKDVFNGTEMISDSYKHEVIEDGAGIEFYGKFITKKNEAFADIGGEDAEFDASD